MKDTIQLLTLLLIVVSCAFTRHFGVIYTLSVGLMVIDILILTALMCAGLAFLLYDKDDPIVYWKYLLPWKSFSRERNKSWEDTG